jgi:hypothetical protein
VEKVGFEYGLRPTHLHLSEKSNRKKDEEKASKQLDLNKAPVYKIDSEEEEEKKNDSRLVNEQLTLNLNRAGSSQKIE